MSKKTTIYDIAKALDITAATVSRALNNNPKISKATKALVLKTATEMNYEQNKLALALQSGKSNSVGVIVPRVDSSFFGSIIRGIEEALNPHGYQVIICQTHEEEDKEGYKIEALLNAQVDGILISTTSNSKTAVFSRVLKKKIPLVFFDRRKDMPGVSSVTINDFQGAYKATKHLIDGGFKRIAHCCGNRTLEIFDQRFLGYQQALIDANIEFNANYVIQTNSNIEEGKRAAKQLLALEAPPDAIFSSSDFTALGAIQELKEHGIEVPENFGVVGFSNEPFTKFMELSISSVDQSPLEMGKRAAKVFLEQVLGSKQIKQEQHIVLEPELIVRKSSLRHK